MQMMTNSFVYLHAKNIRVEHNFVSYCNKEGCIFMAHSVDHHSVGWTNEHRCFCI